MTTLDGAALKQLAETLGPMIQAGLRDLAGGASPAQVYDEAAHKKMMGAIRGDGRAERFRWEKKIECKSPLSGSSFTAIVQGTKDVPDEGIVGDPDGFVVRFEKYEYDARCFKHMKDGGLVPDGMVISQNPQKRGDFDQFLYEKYKADVRAYVRGNADERKRLDPTIVIANQESAATAQATIADKDARIAELEAKLAAAESKPKK